ncbi:MAG: helix-turn-helix domain-containing protein [Actinobacteria bacterium]|uniref:Unannotated protein n=1 Tax=freshwater metagenome TaxID=449393 RepID=A0A6J7N8E8_9ZZZZ|nr:helix-turn-helix domain-containing protein [Actinomycetota bacterium]MSW77767.1 helix-turn-helix domain-containing protein [Actinomycetota bacterium]MSX55805.1 helix-turn-helix domain-containing protein [Actinomycetota bacterium]MSX92624.1 helix-turn-helix domain-containing protein [Actinomycetota bacterium]MSZ83112.1 helix-turn-helix domain-containing protein [Actinomycetota bacterium]
MAAGVEFEQGEVSQTLERGLAVLELLGGARSSLTPAQIAGELAIARPIAYRLLRTLSRRRLVVRDDDGTFRIGPGVLDLVRGVASNVLESAMPELTRLADALDCTAVLTIADGDDVVFLATVEPVGTNVHLSYPPGFRRAILESAFGIAILAGCPRSVGEPAAVAAARRRGHASDPSNCVAAPINRRGRDATASIGVQAPESAPFDASAAIELVTAAAARIGIR